MRMSAIFTAKNFGFFKIYGVSAVARELFLDRGGGQDRERQSREREI